MNLDFIDTKIPVLGDARIPTNIIQTEDGKIINECFVSDSERVLIDVNANIIEHYIKKGVNPPSFELAGPREYLYFDPSKLRCALVTCGGLCPGLNDIIRSIVLELFYRYKVKNIYGVRYGLEGFIPSYSHDVMELSPKKVVDIHKMGGSILGSSRGPQDIDAIVDSLERMNIGVLFMIGGDGTLKAASKIDENFMNQIKDYVSNGKLEAADALCKSKNTPTARLIGKGISRIGKPLDDINTAIETAGKLEVYQLEKNVSVLATIAGAAPMIGFLGTVIGMIVAIHEIANAGGQIDIKMLSDGLYTAMTTTVAGLIVGIIAYITYNHLVVRTDKVVYQMEAKSVEFLDLLNEPV